MKNYNSNKINYGDRLIKLFSYKILVKIYNIYELETKTTFMKKVPEKTNYIVKKEGNIFRENINDTKNKKNGDNKEIPNKEIIDSGKNKKQNTDKYYIRLERLKHLIICSIISILLILIVEYLFFYNIQKTEYNSIISYRYLKEFFSLYNKLLTSILSVVCIAKKTNSKDCRNYLSIFNEIEASKNKNDDNFNSIEYVITQNKILSQKLMEQKANIMNIREYLGIKKYEKLFNAEMKYLQINKGHTLNVYKITLRFFFHFSN